MMFSGPQRRWVNAYWVYPLEIIIILLILLLLSEFVEGLTAIYILTFICCYRPHECAIYSTVLPSKQIRHIMIQCWKNVGQRRRWWANISPALNPCVVFAEVRDFKH